LRAFISSLENGSTSMAELIQATKVYYSTVERFLTSNLLLLNLRHVTGHIKREIYGLVDRRILAIKVCGDTQINGTRRS